MGFINRFLLFFYTLCVALLSLGVILLVLHVVPERNVWNEYQYLIASWQTGAGALLFFLVSVHLLFCSFSRGNSSSSSGVGDAIVVKGENGSVQVTMDAIRNMVLRISSNVNGVRDTSVSCSVKRDKKDGDNILFDVRLAVGEDRSIGSVSDDVKNKVAAYMENVVGISAYKIEVAVEKIEGGVAVKKRRVV